LLSSRQLSKAGGNSVWLGADDTASPTTGYQWDGFDPISLPIKGPLFGVVGNDGSNPTGVVITWAQVSL
jgi:hypothetical protein